MIAIDITRTRAVIRRQEALTTGLVGAKVEFRFDDSWDGLNKTAVFEAAGVTKDVIGVETEVEIPWEVLTTPGAKLKIGVFGASDDGKAQIPTVWAKTEPIRKGADPSGEEGADPSLPVWEQVMEVANNAVKSVNGQKPDEHGNVEVESDVVVDDAFDDNSENPVQNKVVKAAIDEIHIVEEGITNLFDKADPEIVVDYYVLPATDALYAAAWYKTTGYMPIENGKTYTFPVCAQLYGWTTTGQVALYDGDKNHIGYASGTIGERDILTVTISNADAAFIRTTMNTSATGHRYGHGVSNMMVVVGTEYPSAYIPYGETAGGKNEFNGAIPLAQEHIDQAIAQASPLYGKKVVFTGDSICHALTDEGSIKGWAGRIGTKHKMDWTNTGVSGATITNKTITGSTGCIADTDFGENPDYIIIEGGANDADIIGCQVGEDGAKLKDENGRLVPNATHGSYNLSNYGYTPFNTDTFCGAVEHLFRRVTTDYAGAKIGFIIAHKMGGWDGGSHNYTASNNVRRLYFETIIALCKKWGIPYIDLWDGCYLNPSNATHNSGDHPFYYNADMQHLTEKGYGYITPMIEKWMESL